MYYDPSLGRQGNIEKALRENQYRKNEICNEESTRSADVETAQQMLTDSYLDNVAAQQDITALMLEVEELKRRNEV